MPFRSFNFWAIASVVLFLTLRASAQGPAAAPFAGGIVSDWTGSVEVQLSGKASSKPQRGQVLPEGTVISTADGRVLLTLRADESKILIRPHTRVILHEPSSTNWNTLELLLGRIRAYIQKRTGGAPPFQLGTPSAVIAVRGTRFDVEVNGRGDTEVDVFDGLVEVAGTGLQGQSVLVQPGFSTRVAPGGVPETPVPTREMRPDVDSPAVHFENEFSRGLRIPTDRTLEAGESEIQGPEMGDVHETQSEREGPDH